MWTTLYCAHSKCGKSSIWELGKYPVPDVVEPLKVIEKCGLSGAVRIQYRPNMLLRCGLMVGVEATDVLIHTAPKMNWTVLLLGGISLHRNRDQPWCQLRCRQE